MLDAEINENSTSPIKKAKEESKGVVTTNFYNALRLLAEGAKITRLEWDNTKIYGELRNAVVSLHKADDEWYVWSVSEGDLIGEDWIVIE